MGVLYPGPVSRHNLVCPLLSCLSFSIRVPLWDGPRRWSLCLEVDTGPPRTRPMGTESEWPRECHDNEMVSSECRWSTRMGVRGHGFRSVGTVY